MTTTNLKNASDRNRKCKGKNISTDFRIIMQTYKKYVIMIMVIIIINQHITIPFLRSNPAPIMSTPGRIGKDAEDTCCVWGADG
jgi:hypothetical protein